MRVVAITQIWPNRLEPLTSPFNVQQFKALAKLCDLSVLCAVPYFPGAHRTGLPPRAALLARLPDVEIIEGIETTYMRYAYLPKGVAVAVPLYYASLFRHRARIRNADVVLATWAYPDGCAGALMADRLGRPCAIKVHGSDINVVAKMRAARLVLRNVLPRADALVAVSRPLAAELRDLGAAPERIHFVPNGVDAALFAPADRAAARRELGIAHDRRVVVFVGRLQAEKGVGELLDAWPRVRAAHPTALVALVGDGPWFDRVRAYAARDASVVAPGACPLREVARWLAASDVFTLPSWAEGTPNVVLEALASGRPVVASSAGGIPEWVDADSGLLVPPRDSHALGRAINEALARTWNPEVVRARGPRSWDDSARALYCILHAIAGDTGSTQAS